MFWLLTCFAWLTNGSLPTGSAAGSAHRGHTAVLQPILCHIRHDSAALQGGEWPHEHGVIGQKVVHLPPSSPSDVAPGAVGVQGVGQGCVVVANHSPGGRGSCSQRPGFPAAGVAVAYVCVGACVSCRMWIFLVLSTAPTHITCTVLGSWGVAVGAEPSRAWSKGGRQEEGCFGVP
jgi:hypothetical protein